MIAESSISCTSLLFFFLELSEEAEAVLASTNITDEQRKSYEDVSNKFNLFFKTRHNVIFERARFNKRNRLPGESAETYIVQLYTLAENCEYGALTEQMIRDRLVIGIRDAALSRKLQLDADLTLERAKTLVRQQEAVSDQQRALKGELTWPGSPSQATRPRRNQSLRRCYRCGRTPHPKETCPAGNAQCYLCNRIGHFRSQCPSNPVLPRVDDITEESSPLDLAFLGNVEAVGSLAAWRADLLLLGYSVQFKLDTGLRSPLSLNRFTINFL